MQTVEIKYEGKSLAFELASEWNELNEKQLLFIAKFWEKWRAISQEGESLIVAKMQLLLRLIARSKRENKKHVKVLKQLSGEQMYDIAQLSNFVFDDNKLTTCPLPKVTIGFRKYYAPNNELANITAKEFAFAEANFLAYHKTNNIKHLEMLIATIYRPFNPEYKNDGQLRLPFIKEKIDHYQASLKKLSSEQKQLICLWYIGCRMAIVKKFPSVFTTDNESSAESLGWISIIMELAGNKFGTFEETADTDLHLLLIELQSMSQKASKNKQIT